MHEFLRPYDEPMSVQAVEGEVVVLGPDGVAVSLTPDSAAESARRLTEGAEEARRQAAAPGDEDAEPPSVLD